MKGEEERRERERDESYDKSVYLQNSAAHQELSWKHSESDDFTEY